MGYGAATIGGGDVPIEDLDEPEPPDEVVDEGKRSQPLGEESERRMRVGSG
jgi:hypothetical protein